MFNNIQFIVRQSDHTGRFFKCNFIVSYFRIRFRPTRAGTISIGISVVGRAIKGRTLQTEVNKLSSEDVHWGGRGSGRDQCIQPVAAAFCPSLATLYILDAGNSRVHLLDEDLTTKDYIENEGNLFTCVYFITCII